MKLTNPRSHLVDAALWLFGLCFFTFSAFFRPIDIGNDIRLTQSFITEGVFRPNFIFYALNAALAGWSTSISALACSAGFILGSAWFAKFKLVQSHFRCTKISILLLFAFSLPAWYNNWYLGQIPPNVWHNSTLMLLMPIAIALYASGKAAFAQPIPRHWLTFSLLSVVAVLIKPSFLFCYYPTLFLFALTRHRQILLPLGLAMFPAVAIIGWQYLALFGAADASKQFLSGEDGGVNVSFLKIWSHYSDFIPLSILLSLPFPLYITWKYRTRLSQGIYFTWVMFAIAILQFAFLAETGARAYHANFMWQAVIANFFLHYESAKLHQEAIGNFNWKNLGWQILSMQSLVGVLYVLRIIIRGGME